MQVSIMYFFRRDGFQGIPLNIFPGHAELGDIVLFCGQCLCFFLSATNAYWTITSVTARILDSHPAFSSLEEAYCRHCWYDCLHISLGLGGNYIPYSA